MFITHVNKHRESVLKAPQRRRVSEKQHVPYPLDKIINAWLFLIEHYQVGLRITAGDSKQWSSRTLAWNFE